MRARAVVGVQFIVRGYARHPTPILASLGSSLPVLRRVRAAFAAPSGLNACKPPVLQNAVPRTSGPATVRGFFALSPWGPSPRASPPTGGRGAVAKLRPVIPGRAP